MNFALMFPGQGAQSPGFLHALPEHTAVRETLEEASGLLAHDVLTLDTEAALNSTVVTQITLVVAGAAFVRLCAAEQLEPAAVAGMSVGAFAAAIGAGAIDLGTALTLVRRRAEWMEAAFPPGTHGMLAVDGLRLNQIKRLIEHTNVVIANYNSPAQYVLAGGLVALEALVQPAQEAGAHRATMLRMSVASHVPALLPASEKLLELARKLPFEGPRIPVYSSRTARPLVTADAVREDLALNMAYSVRWYDTVTALHGLGTELFLEAPPGHSLSRLTMEALPEARSIAAEETRWDVIVRAARRAA
jgi:malonate decarboxylase epsilon subunit